jgi:hypothetical protein
MFIHLGGDILVESEKIIALINLENSNGLNYVQQYLGKNKSAEQWAELENHSYKSAVLTDNGLLFSPISTTTLKKRADFIENL